MQAVWPLGQVHSRTYESHKAGSLQFQSKATPSVAENYVPGMLLDPIEVEYHGESSDHTSGIASYENLQIHKIEQVPATVSRKMEVELSAPLSSIRARGHRSSCKYR